MTLRIRRLIFWGLVIIFLIITPLIIAYGIGYSFDWQKRSFVKTGSFYFASAPTGGTIYINYAASGKTNKYIKRLLPKEYNVAIKKDGYQIWEKGLKMDSGIVTEARNILLVPQNPKIETVQKNLPPGFSLTALILTDSEKQKLAQASSAAKTVLANAPYQLSDDDIFFLETDYILYKTDLSGRTNSKYLSNRCRLTRVRFLFRRTKIPLPPSTKPAISFFSAPTKKFLNSWPTI